MYPVPPYKLPNQFPPINKMLTAVIKKLLPLTAAYSRSFLRSASGSNFFSTASESGVAETAVNQSSWLTRLPSLVEGCDYEHWLVVMEAPKGYPLRDELVNGYVKTLAMALGSEEEAKKAMYSVSTKYYYGFGCIVPGILTYKIQSLPNVRWVLPDSYLCHGENNYGGEQFVDGAVVPYDAKYHEDWLQDKETD